MKNFMRGWRSRGFLLNRLGFNFAWDLIQEGVGYPNRNKAWKGVPVQVPSAGLSHSLERLSKFYSVCIKCLTNEMASA